MGIGIGGGLNVNRGFVPQRYKRTRCASNAEPFSAQGIPVLISLSEECDKADVRYAVVTGHPVQRLLRIGDPNHRCRRWVRVSEALQRLAAPRNAGRLLPIVTKSA